MDGRVVVLGAGTGGTLTANLLAKDLRAQMRRGEAGVTVVGEGGGHAFQPANLDVAFKGAPPERFLRPQRPLLRPGVAFTDAGAHRVDAARRVVHLKDGTELPYDALVLATGAHARPDAMPGLEEASLNFHAGPRDAARIWRALQGVTEGRVVVAIAGVPYKCPPSPAEAAFLLDEHFRRRGARGRVEIRLVTPYPRPYPAAPISGVIAPRLEARGVEVTTFFNMERADPARKVIASLEGEEIPYDLLIAVPPHRGAEVIQRSGLGDAEGWIPTDKETMRVEGREGVFALGDATAIPISKSGVVAHLQSAVVARNVRARLLGERVERAFEGRINCPMEVGDRRALFVSATYARAPEAQRPTHVRYAMKKAFGRMYWTVLKGDLEWMFHAYFGRTSHEREAPLARAR